MVSYTMFKKKKKKKNILLNYIVGCVEWKIKLVLLIGQYWSDCLSPTNLTNFKINWVHNKIV